MRVIKWVACFLGGIIALQSLYFAVVLWRPNTTGSAQAIVVFMGSEKRTSAGYDLARMGRAPLMVLSPSTPISRGNYDRRYGLPNTVTHLAEAHARTTLENAYYVARVIQENALRSVILVTSDYHMPRSLALLRLFLLNEKVAITPYKVSAGQEGKPPAGYRGIMAKLIYNEMVEFWGSLANLVAVKIAGDRLDATGVNFRGFAVLRGALMMDVSGAW